MESSRSLMKPLSRNAIIGYPAGIITGITYGLNPLFAMPLMNKGAAIESILFFRYLFAVLILGGFLMLRRQDFKVSLRQAGILLALGLLYTSSSLCLFESYRSGYDPDIPLSGAGRDHHGIPKGRAVMASLAGDSGDIRRRPSDDSR